MKCSYHILIKKLNKVRDLEWNIPTCLFNKQTVQKEKNRKKKKRKIKIKEKEQNLNKNEKILWRGYKTHVFC